MSGGPQEYIAYELVLASPAVSCVPGSSNLYSFCDGGQVSGIVGVSWGVVARTCLILLSTFCFMGKHIYMDRYNCMYSSLY